MDITSIISRKKRTEPLYQDSNNQQYILITGGAGFVGVNLADRLLSEGRSVLVFDNLSRDGVKKNLNWLKQKHADNLQIIIGDIRDKTAVEDAVRRAAYVFHFAAQVAVTTSLLNPHYDFEVNALGTLNLLEAIRKSKHQPAVFYTSTNKVYGDLEDVGLTASTTRYFPQDTDTKHNGISEKRNLDFHSPYGCTKGVSEQYMLDYSRTFGLKTVVFRMSCIYGPHQFGNEDQGWIAHFLIKALSGEPITLYGDGKQVRDILYIDDLVNAFMLAQQNINIVSGKAFNIGGGVNNTISLLELIDLIGDISGSLPKINFDSWRPSDQKYYVSDYKKFKSITGWEPKYNTSKGVACLHKWLQENVELLTKHEKPVKKNLHTQLAPIDK